MDTLVLPTTMSLVGGDRYATLISMKSPVLPSGYNELLDEISTRISTSQVRAALGVSRELVTLYWSIGREILVRQRTEGWGA
jgi:hypothetical protein